MTESNTLSGTVVGPVIQARNVQGGVHFHQEEWKPIAPRQLLPAPGNFTNRKRELKTLNRIAGKIPSQSAPTLVLVTGPSGVGKTALALRWLHTLIDRFTDGQLYVDLGRADMCQTSNALGPLIRSLGVAATSIPTEPAEQETLYRSLTAGKSLILLLDNISSVTQVKALLPASSTSLVVATSQRRLGGLATLGAQSIQVDPLSKSDAVSLLANTVGKQRISAESFFAEELVTLCSGMPIAVNVVAAQLSARPRWSIARVAKELLDERQRLSALTIEGDVSVQVSFDLSYRELPVEVARGYRLLALHPGVDFCAAVAAAGMGLTSEQGAQVLNTLVERNLLSDIAENRYRFHDLLRVHAKQQVERCEAPDEQVAAVRRFVEWYLDQAVAADVVATPLRPHFGERYAAIRDEAKPLDAEAALDWLELELANLMAALRAAHGNGWHDLAWQLCGALWGVFLYRGHYEEWLPAYELGIESARQDGNLNAQARMLVQLAAYYHRVQRFDKARELAKESLERARAAGNRRSESTALESLGMAARGEGRLAESIAYHEQSLVINEELESPRGMALQLRSLGSIHSKQNQHRKAIDYFQRTKKLAITVGDPIIQAQALAGMGLAFAKLNRFAEAVLCLEEALELSNVSTAPAYRVDVLQQLAQVYRQMGDVVEARKHLTEAADLYTRLGDQRADRVLDTIRSLEMVQ